MPTMGYRQEQNKTMTIPRPHSDTLFNFIGIMLVALSFLVAVAAPCVSLWLAAPYFWLGLAASLLWLGLVGQMTWNSCKDAGGLRRYVIDIVAGVYGRLFAEITTASPQALELGVYLAGRRFVQQTIPLGSVEAVEWNTGQATSMAGHDMNDWQVWVWFDHADPAKSEKERRIGLRKPDQDLYGVGPATRKHHTEALGLSLVAFLLASGADLVNGPTPESFVRRQADEG